MRTALDEKGLIQRLADAGEQANRPLDYQELAAVVAEVVGTLDGDVTAADFKVYRELSELATYIKNARAEIAAIRPSEIREDFIASASDELDAVVGATEDATNRIMDAAERIMSEAGSLPDDPQTKIIDDVTEIFEACNFQDITGQRITKVVRALKHIEEKIAALVDAMGEEAQAVRDAVEREQAEKATKPLSDEDLLNGPQMADEAIDQNAIDKLLADFD